MGLQQPPPLWQVIGASVRGAAHKRENKPCQDAVQWRQADEFAVLAVADGHGSERSPYSDRGAQIAVEVAVALLHSLYTGFLTGPATLSAVKRYAEEQLSEKIVREWRERVKKDYAANLSDGGVEREPLEERDLLVGYGSTLLAALLAQDFLFFLQLGDGDILAVAGDGTVVRPIPRDERLIANETTSLSTPDAWREVRVAFLPIHDENPVLVLLSTDGYANSFVSDQDFLQVGADYLRLIREEGIEWLASQLEAWLNEASAQGSGDDITVSLAFRSTLSERGR